MAQLRIGVSLRFCHPPTVAGGEIKLALEHPMKTILALSILFSLIALPALGQLRDADLNKIRLIVKDEVKSEIIASEERMKTYVDTKVDGLKTPITWLIGILVAMIAVIGLPLAILTMFLGWRSVRDTSLQHQIDAFAKAIESQN